MAADKLKWRVNRAVRDSRLPAPARLIMFVLSDRANVDTGVIPDNNSPSLKDLAHDTGLNKATIARQLPELERLGWVVCGRPNAVERASHATTTYRIQIGSEVAESDLGSEAPESHSTTPPKSQRATSKKNPRSQSATAEVAECDLARSQSATSYLKDDDHNDLDDLSTTADAATDGGRDALFEAPPTPKRTESAKQRAYRLASTYTGQIQLSNKDAVATVVHKAVLSTGLDGKPYTDEQITAALQQLITERRSVTANSLRIALDGPPLPGQRMPPKHETYRDADTSTFRPPK